MPERPTARQWLSRNARRASFWPWVSVAAGGASTLLLFALAWAIAGIVQKMVLDHADFAALTPYLVVLPGFQAYPGLACVRFPAPGPDLRVARGPVGGSVGSAYATA